MHARSSTTSSSSGSSAPQTATEEVQAGGGGGGIQYTHASTSTTDLARCANGGAAMVPVSASVSGTAAERERAATSVNTNTILAQRTVFESNLAGHQEPVARAPGHGAAPGARVAAGCGVSANPANACASEASDSSPFGAAATSQARTLLLPGPASVSSSATGHRKRHSGRAIEHPMHAHACSTTSAHDRRTRTEELCDSTVTDGAVAPCAHGNISNVPETNNSRESRSCSPPHGSPGCSTWSRNPTANSATDSSITYPTLGCVRYVDGQCAAEPERVPKTMAAAVHPQSGRYARNTGGYYSFEHDDTSSRQGGAAYEEYMHGGHGYGGSAYQMAGVDWNSERRLPETNPGAARSIFADARHMHEASVAAEGQDACVVREEEIRFLRRGVCAASCMHTCARCNTIGELCCAVLGVNRDSQALQRLKGKLSSIASTPRELGLGAAWSGMEGPDSIDGHSRPST